MKLRDYQQNAIDLTLARLQDDESYNPIIELPTGAGKSVVIGELNKQLVQLYNAKILNLSHNKEIIVQNYQKLASMIPEMHSDIALYCSALEQKNIAHITVASIQSIYKVPNLYFDFVLIDECHLVSVNPDSMYQKLFASLRENNPKVRFIGLSATPYRKKTALVDLNMPFNLFSIRVNVKNLIEKNYLCNLKTPHDLGRKLIANKINLSNVKTVGDDYNQSELNKEVNNFIDNNYDELFNNLIDNLNYIKALRILFFASSVEIATKLNEKLKDYFTSNVVTGETPIEERDKILHDFKQMPDIKIDLDRQNLSQEEVNQHRLAVVNCEVLTTGFDAPNIDCIVFLRPTKSYNLYMQMMGRGLRIHNTKSFTYILDYADNISVFGAIDKPMQSNDKKSSKKGEATPYYYIVLGQTEAEAKQRKITDTISQMLFEHRQEADKLNEYLGGYYKSEPLCQQWIESLRNIWKQIKQCELVSEMVKTQQLKQNSVVSLNEKKIIRLCTEINYSIKPFTNSKNNETSDYLKIEFVLSKKTEIWNLFKNSYPALFNLLCHDFYLKKDRYGNMFVYMKKFLEGKFKVDLLELCQKQNSNIKSINLFEDLFYKSTNVILETNDKGYNIVFANEEIKEIYYKNNPYYYKKLMDKLKEDEPNYNNNLALEDIF